MGLESDWVEREREENGERWGGCGGAWREGLRQRGWREDGRWRQKGAKDRRWKERENGDEGVGERRGGREGGGGSRGDGKRGVGEETEKEGERRWVEVMVVGLLRDSANIICR